MSQTYIPKSLRNLVLERAENRCEYCRISQLNSFIPHEIDHIISEQHKGETIAENLGLACYDCNRFKGPNLSSYDHETKEIVRLFNPRFDHWGEHFTLAHFHVIPLTQIGKVTISLLQMNREKQIMRRSAG